MTLGWPRFAAEAGSGTSHPGEFDAEHWYKDAVVYELHVRAYQDSDGDGIGDFRGLASRLDYLQDLGVTALWLLPFYPSPLRDDGYDISDYRRVHPSYGTLRDFRRFLSEAHERGLRVITELVLAHTSDEHPWFQRARRARSGTKARDFYLWSDTADRLSEARVIFKDFESSNWTWDPVAQAYFWHRFYSHQPSLNYDNPDVQDAIIDIVDYWFEMGVDGLRLDAVPYLFAREGTTSENLPETFDFLRRLRAHVDERFSGRMLLAEANQWPEDAVAYLGKGDVCHMAFHFPLMPRIFMAARQEDRFPIVDILTETPEAPPNAQWALFLRNHDELTLEMVTDEERDYMYRAYAQDPQARLNVGIRRRLAPLLGNDRRLIEMMNGLLCSLPGTPIVYYGDEIGMGDNIYLGDRNGVRTPMQWAPDRNAGFSRANPQRLYLPVVADPEYQPQAVNVEAQAQNPSSLLWWMKRLIALRNRYRAFGRGQLQLLRPDNRKVIAFLRCFEEERILVIVNLSRYGQAVQLDLSEFRNAVPVELFGGTEFPTVGDLPYLFTLGPHDFYWFSLETHSSRSTGAAPAIAVPDGWEGVLEPPALTRLEEVLQPYVIGQRWFRDKARRVKRVRVVEIVPVPTTRGGARLVLVEVDLDTGSPETYLLPLAFASEGWAQDLRRYHAEAIVAELRAGNTPGVLYDAVWDPAFCRSLLDIMGRRRQIPGNAGRLFGVPTPSLRRLRPPDGEMSEPVPISAEQSNSSVAFGEQLILKLFRRVEHGVHPGVELGRFLTERARFPSAPQLGGSVEYRPYDHHSTPATLATAEQFVPNEGDGWSYVVDALRRGLEESLARPEVALEGRHLPPPDLLALAASSPATPDHPLLGPHFTWAALLGQRTAELHLALASASWDPDLAPEPLTALDRQSLYHGARTLLRRSFRQARSLATDVTELAEVLDREGEILERLRRITTVRIATDRIRVHGDYHLGQVLWTGKDFVVIDFEGEPARSLGQRRLRRPALVDVAGMVRSLHYASRAAALVPERDVAWTSSPDALAPLLVLWYRSVAAMFLRSYLDAVGNARFVPHERSELAILLDFLLLEKAVYEIGYEINARPDWVSIPARGILDLLETGG
jgi:maltose alpha-D-glucosyltransferase / alpha-amylase